MPPPTRTNGDVERLHVKASLRPAQASEIEPVRSLLRSAYGQYESDLPPENWQRYLADIVDLEARAGTSELLVAENGGSILGCVSYYPPGLDVSYPSDAHSEAWPPDWSAIRLLAVTPEARGKGVGRLLTEHCIARSRDQGAVAVGLHTVGFMTVAQAMYERMGFERTPRYDFRPAPTILVEAYSLRL